MQYRSFPFLQLSALLAFTVMARAELLVYEPFDYRPINDEVHGRLEGRNGGMGFAAPWMDTGIDATGKDQAYGCAFVYDQRGNPKNLYDGEAGLGNLAWDGVVDNLPTMGGYVSVSDWRYAQDRMNSSRRLARSAGEMAKASGGTLWLSAVWHYPNQSFYAPIGIVLTSKGGGLSDRANNITNQGDGLGVGNGTKDLSAGKKRLNIAHWQNGEEVSYAVVGDPSREKDNIIILKYQFGEKDRVSVWHFGEDQEMTEASFDKHAVTLEASIDENALDTLAFSCISDANAVDEFRIGTDFKSVISGKIEPRKEVKITKSAYDAREDRYFVAWSSNPGETYGLYLDEDAGGFRPSIAPMVVAAENKGETSYGPFANPRPGNANLKFAVGLPDSTRPKLERTLGSGNTIRLHFSEPMHPAPALAVDNYQVLGDGGEVVALDSARFHPGTRTVELTTAKPLAPMVSYAVSVRNLTDRAGLPLANGKASFKTWDDHPDGVKVFILAGQSNMLGRGWYDKGQNEKFGGIGSLREQVVNHPDQYGHLVDAEGKWRKIPSIKMWQARSGLHDMTVGFGSGPDCIGPEFGFAWAIREHFKDQHVLLIKTAWGGKSLYTDFRPPEAVARRGGCVGPYYLMMIEEVHAALARIAKDYPEFMAKGYQIAGFGWHQGFNDMLDPVADSAYEDNLVGFIHDIRAEFGKAKLPFSIGATGHGGMSITPEKRLTLAGQLAVADPQKHPEFAGNVFTIDTRPFQRSPEESPRADGSHWHYNGATLYQIGKGMGDGMVGLLGK